MTKLWCFIWFMAPVSLCQVNPSVKRLLDTWLGFRCKLVPQICVVHPNEQSSHGCDSLIGVLFWCILHFVLHGMVIVYSSATNRSTYCIALLVCPALAIGSKCTKLFHAALNRRKYLLLSGEPDYFGRNKILSGYDLSHYQVPHCIKSFLLFCLICVYSSQFSILFWIMYLL